MTRSDSGKTPATADEARADIEIAREELGDTVEALAHKVNVRERAKERWQDKTEPLREKAQQAKQQWEDRTEPVRDKAHAAADVAKDKAPQPVVQSAQRVAANPGPLLIGAGLAVIVGWLVTTRRNR